MDNHSDPSNSDNGTIRLNNSYIPVDQGHFTVSEIIAAVMRGKYLIAGMVFAMLVLGLAHIFIAQPTYRTNALIQLKQQGLGVAAIPDLSGLSSLFEGSTIDSEIEILRSRTVLGQVVKDLKLDISASPKHFPIIGEPIARRLKLPVDVESNVAISSKKNAFKSWLSDLTQNSKYAWGDEYIKVEQFEVPNSYLGEAFKLVAGDAGNYSLYDKDKNLLFSGNYIEQTPLKMDLGEGALVLNISKIHARPGTHFNLFKNHYQKVINNINEAMITSKVENVDRLDRDLAGTGLMRISLSGDNPVFVSTMLNKILAVYTEVGAKRKTADADKSLQLLHDQRVVLEEQTEASQEALNKYRLAKGSVNLPLETEAILKRSVDIETKLSELRQNRALLLKRFTNEHHDVAAINAQISTLNNQLTKIESKVKVLPETQRELLRLSRALEVNSQLYSLLLSKVNELKVIKAGTVGDVTVVDAALPAIKPAKPVKALILAIYVMLGFIIGLTMLFMRRAQQDYVEDPKLIEHTFGLTICAVVPRSNNQATDKKTATQYQPLALTHPNDIALESIRSLRTSLQVSMVAAKDNILLITSPSPGVGKSFLSVNLALLFADADRQVLLIDADLRRGRIHKNFDMERANGLSDFLNDDCNANEVIRETPHENLKVITTGELPDNPSELLSGKRFTKWIADISSYYDLVIIDSPPVLPVTDAVILAERVGTTLLALNSNQHHLREVEECVKRLKQSRANICGAVINNMDTSAVRYGYGRFYGYGYEYGRSSK